MGIVKAAIKIEGYNGINLELLRSNRGLPAEIALFQVNLPDMISPSSLAAKGLSVSSIAPFLTAHCSASSKTKRCLDVVGSLVGLLILGILVIPIAVAIKLDSAGSIFYSQKRYGLLGRPFRIYKFRSMVANAEGLKSQIQNDAKGLIFKNKTDPRITKVGRFLRCTSLDELPQFWNVLWGEMSLVGTRPPTADEVAHYQPHHWQRLSVKPGITGEWQVNGRSNVKDFEEIVKLDLRYQTRWHRLYDLVLIAKTLRILIGKVGAC